MRSFDLKANFFISSSYYEGYPLVLSEAMGMGAIPILSDIEIYEHIVKETKIGTNLNFSNTLEAYEKLSKYVEKTNLKKSSENIEKFAKKQLTWKKIAKDYMEA